jgi:hypothetical protein
MTRRIELAVQKGMTRTGLLAVLCVAIAGCASAPAPVAQQPVAQQPVAQQPAPAAADNGQPKMQAALQALQQAKGETEAASPNKGGHREQAIGIIQQAIDAVNAGIQYAAEHPTEVGAPEGPAAMEPVNENVPGAERQPHMAQAIVALREARRQLHEAKHDKGGHRVQAIQLIQQALLQLREGIQFANTH